MVAVTTRDKYKPLCSECFTWVGELCNHYPEGQRIPQEQAMIDKAVDVDDSMHFHGDGCVPDREAESGPDTTVCDLCDNTDQQRAIVVYKDEKRCLDCIFDESVDSKP